MWIFTIDGFFSAVQKPNDRNTGRIQVRSRNREDLERFRTRMNLQDRILSTPAGDYPFRIITSKATWGRYLDRMARLMDYSNFKAECDRMGLRRGWVYNRIWDILQDLEDPRPRTGRFDLQDSIYDPVARRQWSLEDEQLYQSPLFKDIEISKRRKGYGIK